MDNIKLDNNASEKDSIKVNAISSSSMKTINYIPPTISSKKKVWDFLNSSIFIWFLSSVIVVIVTNLFNYMKIKSENEQKKFDTVQKLENEISYRIFYAARYLALQHTLNDPALKSKEVYLDTYYRLDNHAFSSKDTIGYNYSLKPEYFSRPFASLLFELQNADTTWNSQIKSAFLGFNKLDNIITLKKYETETTKEAIDNSILIIRKTLLNETWSQYFIDDPFKVE